MWEQCQIYENLTPLAEIILQWVVKNPLLSSHRTPLYTYNQSLNFHQRMGKTTKTWHIELTMFLDKYEIFFLHLTGPWFTDQVLDSEVSA